MKKTIVNAPRMSAVFPGPYSWSISGKELLAGGRLLDLTTTFNTAAQATAKLFLSGEAAPETEIRDQAQVLVFWQRIPFSRVGAAFASKESDSC